MSDDGVARARHQGRHRPRMDGPGGRDPCGRPAKRCAALLAMFGLPCGAAASCATASRASMDAWEPRQRRCLVTARVGDPLLLPSPARRATKAKLVFEDGSQQDIALEERPERRAMLPALDRARISSPRNSADARWSSPSRLGAASRSRMSRQGERIFGLAAQIYGCAAQDDGGIGDMGGVAALAAGRRTQGADALALSPVHALFSADPGRFGPYSPSSRLFYNPCMPIRRWCSARERVREAIERGAISRKRWRGSKRSNSSIGRSPHAPRWHYFARSFESFERVELARSPRGALAADFLGFVKRRRRALGSSMHASRPCRTRASPRIADGLELANMAAANGATRQAPRSRISPPPMRARSSSTSSCNGWRIARSPSPKTHARRAGMRIGLISDLAIGMDGGRQPCLEPTARRPGRRERRRAARLLQRQWPELGADHLLAACADRGRLRALSSRPCGAALRHAGGVRIDHVMGLMRLWLIPEGAVADARRLCLLSGREPVPSDRARIRAPPRHHHRRGSRHIAAWFPRAPRRRRHRRNAGVALRARRARLLPLTRGLATLSGRDGGHP